MDVPLHAPALSRPVSLEARCAMHNNNKLKLGLFGANCSSGRAVTLVPERWTGNWPDNKKLALLADEVGIDFMLPIGRWKGYGGDTDYQGETLETITWATALLAVTKRITVFGTVHAPIFNPVVAAKEMVTADQVGEGRFGLNIVVGWNEGEFEMFGVEQRDHEARYDYAQEWIDVIKLDLVRPRGLRFQRPVSRAEEDPRQAEALWRRAAGDHERRRFGDRPGLRGEELRRLLLPGLAHVARRDRAERAAGARRRRRAWPRHRLLHRRRHHLPADQEGGGGVFPSLHRRTRRLVGGRQHSRHCATSRRRRSGARNS